ncbi:MAG: nucleotidyltransferase family protein [Ardenticatenaceae bacterium]|nr:nucleotidyltransferase family protein [Ardenticatenaceae bacterium]
MTNKVEILQILKMQEKKLRQLGVRRYGLFGSFSHDKATEVSDIDILVEFEPGKKTFLNFDELAVFLEELFERRIDLLTEEGLSPYLGPDILHDVNYVTVD